MAQYYTQKTSALKATKIDTRIIDAKSIQLNGKEIENIGYQDGRVGALAPSNLDLWKGALVENEDGTKEIKDLFCPYNIKYNEDGSRDRLYGWCNPESVEMVDNIVKISNLICYDANGAPLCYFDSENIVSVQVGRYGSYYLNSGIRNGGLFSYMDDNRTVVQHGLNLESFSSPLTNLIDGQGLFSNGSTGCEKLKYFTSCLPNLKNGNHMFQGTNLQYFDVDMPLLETAQYMFGWSEDTDVVTSCQFRSFTSDIKKLKKGPYMFLGNKDLKYFGGDLNELITSAMMFEMCENLTDFNSSINSLVDGSSMFNTTRLNSRSLLNILDTIRNIKLEKEALAERVLNGESSENVYDASYGWQENGDFVYYICESQMNIQNLFVGKITIGLGIENTDEARQQMAEEIGFGSWEEVEQEFTDKGWTVGWQYNGNPSTTSYGLRREETSSIWAKIEEIVPEVDEEGYEIRKSFTHVSKNDHSKKYKLIWFHSTNGSTDGYQYFDSETAACEHFGIISKNEI